jgi:YidC/Oxa1 family membrane protein insertase
LIGYTYLTKPSDEEIQTQRAKLAEQDSLNRLKNQEKIKRLDAQRIEDSIRQSENITTGTGDIIIDSLSKTYDSVSSLSPVQKQHFGIFTNAASGNEDEIIIETEKLKLKLNSQGGFFSYVEIKDYDTYDSNKLVLFTDETSKFSFLLDDNRLQSSELYFKPIIKTSLYRDKDSIYLSGDDVVNIAMRVYPDDGFGGIDESKYFEFDYTIGAKQYMLDFKFNINGLSDYIAPGYNSILLNWEADLTGKEKSIEQERMQSTVFYKYYKDDVDELSLRSEEELEELETKVEWISFKQQFFSMTLIAESSFDEAKVGKSVKNDVDIDKYLQSMFAEIQVPLTGGDLQSIPMKIYYGPNKYKILSKYDYSLDEQIPLGWGFFLLHWINRFVVIPVFDFLSHFGWNYGIIILVLTIILKIVLFPIAYKTYLSSAKMRVLKPEIDEITAKFPKKEDAMKKQQATMDFYKKVGVNPMAGCLPMLLQMPILFALFRFFPASIELRQKSFLWADDLSTYDSIWTFPNGFEIPFYGDHVSLFTLLMTVTTVFYTRLNQSMMGSSSTQMPGMKTMMYLMPVMFLGFFNNYAAGLSYYYFLANVITFIQMFAIRGLIDEDKLRQKLHENKKKPRKKSGFQKKLEEIAKQKQIQSNKK